MSNSQKLTYETLRTVTGASLSATYETIGSPLSFPSAILRIVNTTGNTITISIDGVNDHDVVQTGRDVTYALSQLYAGYQNTGLASGTQFYVKGTSGSGNVYLISWYNA
jgi:hypothetical protein